MSAGAQVWVKTSSHRSRDSLFRMVGWRPAFFKPTSDPYRKVGEFFRIPAHKLDAALRIKGVTHARTTRRDQLRPYMQTRPSQRIAR